MSSPARVLAALIAGLLLGTAISWARQPTLLAITSAIEPVGALWINAIRMTVIPLIVSLLISQIALETPTSLGMTGGRAFLLFLLFIGGAALFSAAVCPPIVKRIWLDASAVAAAHGAATGSTVELPSFREWLIGLVPTNVVKAAAGDAMLPLIIFTTLFACGLARIGAEQRQMLIRFFGAVSATMLVLVRWILALAPVGVFVLSLSLATRAGAGISRALAQYVAVVSGLFAISVLALYPIAALLGGVSLRRFAHACAPAQAVAFSTRSSLASLPAMLSAAEQKLGLLPQVSGLILPVAVSIFKFGSPIGRMTGLLFIGRLYGIEFSAAAVVTMAALVAALSFYTPGIPSGSLFVIAPVFTAFGLPMEGLGLLLASDLIPDMFGTTANVTADMTVATLLSKQIYATKVARAREARLSGSPIVG